VTNGEMTAGKPHYHSRTIGYGDGMFMVEYPDGQSEPLPVREGATNEEASAKSYEMILAWAQRTPNATDYLQTDVHPV
jgi:hypothetical protein